MFNFEEMIHEVDEGLIKDFGVPVEILLSNLTVETRGIFDNPAALSAISDGGWIADLDPELFIMENDLSDKINTRHRVRINNHLFQVLRPPQKDNAGMVKLVLGVINNGDHDNKIRRSISY